MDGDSELHQRPGRLVAGDCTSSESGSSGEGALAGLQAATPWGEAGDGAGESDWPPMWMLSGLQRCGEDCCF